MISSRVKINLISSHVKIIMTSYVLSRLPSLIVERASIHFYVIETSSTMARKHSATFGNLRKPSDIFGNFRKMIGNVRMNFEHCSENFEKSSEIFGKCSEIFGKLLKYPEFGVYIINRILHVRLWIRILSSHVQLDISLIRCAHS